MSCWLLSKPPNYVWLHAEAVCHSRAPDVKGGAVHSVDSELVSGMPLEQTVNVRHVAVAPGDRIENAAFRAQNSHASGRNPLGRKRIGGVAEAEWRAGDTLMTGDP